MARRRDRYSAKAAAARRAIDALIRYRLELTPDNFHVALRLLDDPPPGLRENFATLPYPLQQADFARLGEQFLPQKIDRDALEPLMTALTGALGALAMISLRERRHVSVFAQNILAVQALLEKRPELSADEVGSGLDELALSSLARGEAAERLQRALSVCIEGLQAFTRALEAPSGSPSQATSPEPAAQDGAEATEQAPEVSHGLPDKAGLVSRLEALQASEKQLSGYSVLLCRLKGMDQFRGEAMQKAKDFVLNTLGNQTSRLISADEGAYWVAPQELGLVLGTTSEIELNDFSRKLKRIVDHSVAYARRDVQTLPDLRCRFGGATAYGRTSASQLLGKASLSLQRADFLDEEMPVLSAISNIKGDGRYDSLYGRRAH
ncbi:hypothetical protein [Rhizobium oryzicola]|uniref:GGDEF domain-containing protein n=1 Tax=Rhizobium oryzicola TaxID=1232668 RepID=A0ABT8SV63_9HYPH|nr:hypothetical protein [Rhizobium oryzicola]MDO1582313.1 hypothetical protein [Rhizobium oryzicola]